jgi:hypothetical protein
MGAGFEGDAGGRTLDIVTSGASLLQRGDLGMIKGIVAVGAFAEGPIAPQENAADRRVRGGEGGRLTGQR